MVVSKPHALRFILLVKDAEDGGTYLKVACNIFLIYQAIIVYCNIRKIESKNISQNRDTSLDIILKLLM